MSRLRRSMRRNAHSWPESLPGFHRSLGRWPETAAIRAHRACAGSTPRSRTDAAPDRLKTAVNPCCARNARADVGAQPAVAQDHRRPCRVEFGAAVAELVEGDLRALCGASARGRSAICDGVADVHNLVRGQDRRPAGRRAPSPSSSFFARANAAMCTRFLCRSKWRRIGEDRVARGRGRCPGSG